MCISQQESVQLVHDRPLKSSFFSIHIFVLIVYQFKDVTHSADITCAALQMKCLVECILLSFV